MERAVTLGFVYCYLPVLSALEGGNGASEGPYGLGASHYRRPVHVYGLNVSLSIMVDHIEHHRRNVSSAIMLYSHLMFPVGAVYSSVSLALPRRSHWVR